MFPFNLYILALIASAGVTFASLPCWRRWSHRSGFVDDPGHRKIHDAPISLAGGLAVMTGVVIPLLAAAALIYGGLWMDRASGSGTASAAGSAVRSLVSPEIQGALAYGISARATQLGAILLGACGMVVLGWMDDKHELRPAIKFGGQLLIASIVAGAGVRITLFVDNLLFSYLVTVLWILTVTNAFNFMDNMNGLCAGLGAIGTWHFGSSAAIHGQYLVATLAFLVCGALLGFLPYNFPRASVFLGDTGSHLVGFLMAVLAILPHFYTNENPNALAVLTPLLLLAVPLGDLIWVVMLRLRIGKPFYIGDTNHLSHRLVRRGWGRSQAVLLIWLMAEALSCIAFL